jgi:Ca-activated chloride channel homolog
MSHSGWSRASRSNKGIALIAVVLSVGGLVLLRAPKGATALDKPIAVDAVGGNRSSNFAGPGLRGALTLSHSSVLAKPGFELFGDLKLVADKAEQTARAPIAMAVVLDASGSMQGEKIDEAKRSIRRLIADMQDNDEISLVRYSSSSEVLQPMRRLGDVRSALLASVDAIQADGGTNIPSGLRQGRDTLRQASSGRVKRIILVSDGLDSTRAEAEQLAVDAAESGVVTSSMGIGLDFDEMYMSSVASKGHGNFAFVKDGAALAAFLKRELLETAGTVVENTRVKITLPQGVRFVRATGAEASVDGSEVTLKTRALFSGEENRVFLEFETDLSAGATRVFGTQASWDKIGGGHSDVKGEALALIATTNEAQVTASLDSRVYAQSATIRSSRMQLQATEAFAKGDVVGGQRIVHQNAMELRAAASAAPTAFAPLMKARAAEYETDSARLSAGGTQGKAAAKSAVAREHGFAKSGSL